MPNRDGTGPDGQGPRTGGGRGNCSPNTPSKQPARPTPGRGPRDGRGRGLGRRCRAW